MLPGLAHLLALEHRSSMLNETLKQARRAIVAVVGFTLLTIGVVMLVTPGPGWAVIILGLSVLAAEFVWARRLLKRLKQAGTEIANSIFTGRNKPTTAQTRTEGLGQADAAEEGTHQKFLSGG